MGMSNEPVATATPATTIPKATPGANTDADISEERLGAYIDGLRILASSLTLPTAQTAQGWEDGSFPGAVREIAVVISADTGDTGAVSATDATSAQLDVSSSPSQLEGCEASERAASNRTHLADALHACTCNPCTLDALRRDYTRLFTHPKHALVPIYESHFRAAQEGKPADAMPLLVVNRTAEAADNAYCAAGFKHAAGSMISGDRMDIELTFLALLLERGDFETARTFVADHLQPWAPAFFDNIAASAQTPQYQAIGLFGKTIFCYN